MLLCTFFQVYFLCIFAIKHQLLIKQQNTCVISVFFQSPLTVRYKITRIKHVFTHKDVACAFFFLHGAYCFKPHPIVHFPMGQFRCVFDIHFLVRKISILHIRICGEKDSVNPARCQMSNCSG